MQHVYTGTRQQSFNLGALTQTGIGSCRTKNGGSRKGIVIIVIQHQVTARGRITADDIAAGILRGIVSGITKRRSKGAFLR